jgi:hypothetical protein
MRFPRETDVYPIKNGPVEVEKLEFLKCNSTLISIALALLLILSVLTVLSNSPNSTINVLSASATTDYGNLLQYEWPQIHGDSAFTRFSAGPAPEASDILWKTSIEDIQSYVAAFNGKVFVTTTANVIALDKDTGDIVWNTTLPTVQRWPAVFKIDDTHLVIAKLGKLYGRATIFLPKLPIGPRVFIARKKKFSILRVTRLFKLGISLTHQNHLDLYGKSRFPAAEPQEQVYNMVMEKCSLGHLSLIK